MARVLIVDDEPSVVTLLTRVLEAAHHKVLAMRTVAEGTQALKREPWDVLLVDKHLPDAPGAQLIFTARELHPAIAVVMMTGHPDRFATQELKLDGYLPKPFRSLDVVRQAVTDAIDRRRLSVEREQLQVKLREATTGLNRTN